MIATDFSLNLSGLDAPVDQFFALVQAKNWGGLANLVQQGDDHIVGTSNNDLLVGGNGDDNFVAGFGRDVMKGERGNDMLLSTEGHDLLDGGTGADTFAFDSEPVVGEWDQIRDFTHGLDRIQVQDITFNHVGFGGFTGAAMDAIHLGFGNQARTVDQGLIYNKTKGFLYYDSDGSGISADRVLFARLGAGTDLTYQDFWVV